MPMDVEFLVHDAFGLTRPHWQLATNLEDAEKTFQLALLEDQKAAASEEGGSSSEDENVDGDLAEVDGEGDDVSSSEEEIVEDQDADSRSSADASDEEDEDIVVTRKRP